MVGKQGRKVSGMGRWGVLFASMLLALALMVAAPGQALAQQQVTGTASGQLTVTVQEDSPSGTPDNSDGAGPGGAGGSSGASSASGTSKTGDTVGLAVAGLLVLAAGAAYVVVRSRRTATAGGSDARVSLFAGKDVVAVGAIAVIAAALLLGASAARAMADDQAKQTIQTDRATVSATMIVDADGSVVSSTIDFSNACSSVLSVTGVSVPDAGGAVESTLDGRKVVAGAEAKGAFGIAKIPTDLLDRARAAGGTISVDMAADYTYSTFSVSFDACDGSDAVTQQIDEGCFAQKPADPTREGYVFKGWYSDKECTVEFDFSKPVTDDTTVYAKWAKLITVSFSLGYDGAKAPDSVTIEQGSAIGELPVPSRSGYAFEGWYDGATKASASTAFNSDTTLTAKWVANAYQVTFYLDGSVYSTGTVSYGQCVTRPADPAIEGHTFLGWYADADCATQYDFNSAIKDEGNVSVYGKTQVNTYTVSFDTAGGSAVDSQTVDYGSTATRPEANPTREGYTFAGWYADAACTTEFNFAAPVKADVVVYAKWNIGTYTVSFDTAGGTPVPEAQAIEHGGKASMPVTDPAKQGYEFAGWYANEALTREYDFDAVVAGDLVLHAKWTPGPATYKVELYEQNENGTGYFDKPTVVVTVTGVTGQKTSYQAPSYEGYTANAFEQQTIAADGSTTLKICYDRVAYGVNFYASEADKAAGASPLSTMSVRYGAHASKPADPTRAGCDFVGWYLLNDDGSKRFVNWDDDVMDCRDIDLYAEWAAAVGATPYTVKSSFEQLDGTYKVDEAETYTLHGTADGMTSVISFNYRGYTAQAIEQQTISGDGKTVVTVKYDLNRSKVTFEANGHGQNKSAEGVAYGASLKSLAPSMSEPGYAFAGWFRDAELTQPFDLANDAMGESDLTLYAKWEARGDTKYVVKHLQQSVDGEGYDLVETQTLAGTTDSNTAAAAKSYEGFTADAVTQAKIAGDGSTVVEVKYFRNVYNVTFEANGGSSVDGRYAFYGSTISTPATSRDGYALVGWYSDENLTQAWDFAASTVPAHDVTLYAKWEIETYAVSFDAAGGEPAPEAQTVEHNAKVTRPATDPAKRGYTFAGWFTDEACTQEYDFGSAVTGTLTLHARWTPGPTTYKIELYEQNEEGDGYFAAPTITDTVEGVTGQKTAYQAPSYEGYTANAFEQQTIAADGSTTLKIYYDRIAYGVNFYASEADKAAGATPLSTMSVRYGAHASKPADPTKAGYDFTGWYLLNDDGSKRFIDWDDDVMGAYPDGLNLYAEWKAAEGATPYTVKSSFEQLDGTYKVDEAETYMLHGTADGKTAAEVHTYKGYTAQTIEQQTISGDGKTVVTVKYDLIRSKVTFEANGHGQSKSAEGVAYGTNLKSLAPSMSEAGYDFNGWFRDAELTQPFDLTNDTMSESDLTLYAKWDARSDTKYTVKHLLQNVAGDGYDLAETETLTGTTGKDTAAAGKSYEGFTTDAVTQAKIAGDGNTVVEVKYTRNTYNVSFETTGGTPAPAAQRVKYGASATAPTTDPAREGYVFKGWYADKDCTVKADFGSAITSNTTFYAKWAKIVTVSFVAGYDGAEAIGSVSLEEKTAVGDKLPASPARTGYDFAGWKDADGNTVTASSTFDKDTTLTAQWTPGMTTYKVELYEQNEEGPGYLDKPTITDVVNGITGQTTDYKEPTYEGYTLKTGVTQATIAADGSTTLKAYYDRNEYTVTFDVQGIGAAPDPIKVRYCAHATSQKPADPEVNGYIFYGWYLDKECTQAVNWDTDVMDCRDITVYAKWEVNSGIPYKVERLIDDGNGNYVSYSTETYYGTAGEAATVPAVKYRGFTAQDAPETTIAADCSTTVQVKYDRNKHTLTYNAGDVGESKTISNVAYGTKLEGYTPAVDGHTFEGWFLDEAFTKPWDPSSNVMPDNDVTLYAKWTYPEFTVVYHSNGGTLANGTASDSGEYTYSQKFRTYDTTSSLESNRFTNDGKVLAYWTLGTADSSATTDTLTYMDGHSLANGGLTCDDGTSAPKDGTTVNLYAHWVDASVGDYWIATANADIPDGTVSFTASQVADEVSKEASGTVSNTLFSCMLSDSGNKSTWTSSTRHLYTYWTEDAARKLADRYVEFRIVQVDEHDGDGSNVTFMAVHSLPTAQQMNSSGSNTDGWSASKMRSDVMGDYVEANLPSGFVSVLDKVSKSSVKGSYGNWNSPTTATTDKVWLMSAHEISGYESTRFAAEGSQYEWFASKVTSSIGSNDVISGLYQTRSGSLPESASAESAWLRSPDRSFSNGFAVLVSDGSSYASSNADARYGVCPALSMGVSIYTVAYNANGGQFADGGDSTTQSVMDGKYASAPATAPTNSGYAFAGWYTSADGGKTLSDEPFDFANTAVTSDMTLYAKWSAPEYTVVYHSNGGALAGATANADGEYTYSEQIAVSDTSAILTANKFTNDGKVLAYWTLGTADSSATTSTLTYMDGHSMANGGLKNDSGSDAKALDTINLYAHWVDASVGDYWIAAANAETPDANVAMGASRVAAELDNVKAGGTSSALEGCMASDTGNKDSWTADTQHLYTYWTEDAATKLADRYVEFRIVQVGQHDGDGSAVTLMAVHSLLDAQKMNDNSTNAGGWEKSAMRGLMSSYVEANLPAGFVFELKSASKQTANGSYGNWGSVTSTSDKVWLMSYSEIFSENGEYAGNQCAKEGSQYEWFSGKTANSASSTNISMVGVEKTRSGSIPTGVSSKKWGTWWLRSPYKTFEFSFAYLNDEGVPGGTFGFAVDLKGVVPAVSLGVDAHTVTYDANGGKLADGSDSATQRVMSGEHATALNAGTATPGYEFEGWYTSADGGKTLSDTPYDFKNTTVTGDITLYAKWKARTDTKYTVKHLQQDVSGETYTLVDTQELTGTTDTATAAKANTYEGFAAQGFQQVNIAGDGTAVVEIKYSRNTYTVTFETDGGSAVEKQTVPYGSKLTQPETTKTGYSLAGWYSDRASLSHWNFDSDTVPASDLTLFATWSANVYTVTFHAGDHGSDPLAQEVSFGSSASEPSVTATGYHVVGWYTDKSLTNKFDFSMAVGASLDLYAKWEIDTYAVSFDANGGQGAPADQTVTYGGVASEPQTAPTKGDSVFKGWFYDAEGTVKADFSRTVTCDMVYYAKWADLISVTFDSAGGSSVSPSSLKIEKGSAVGDKLPTPERKGYKFDGWFVEGSDTAITADTTFDVDTKLTAHWTEANTTYKVELYEQNEEGTGYLDKPTITDVVAGVTGQTTDYKEPTYEGYTLKTGVTQAPIAADGSTTLKAYYNRNQYTVTFDVQGIGTAPDPIRVRYCAHATKQKPADPTADGYTFNGWYLNKECTQAVNWDTDVMDCHDITLYAKWDANSGVKYTVERWIDNGKGGYYKYDSDVHYGTAGQTIEVVAITYRGYTAQDVGDVTIGGDGNTVVKVYYDRNKHTLTYNAGGIADNKVVENVAYETWPEKYTPTASGYTFEGWYMDEALAKPWDATFDIMPDKDLTLYAKWSPAVDTKYTVKHYLENLEAGTYAEEPAKVETLTGTTGDATAAKALEFAGYTAKEIAQEKIAADGSTVVSVYYERKVYTLNLYIDSYSQPDKTLRVRIGETVEEPTISRTDKFVTSWYYTNDGSGSGTFDFSQPISADLFGSGTSINIHHNLEDISDSYWLAPASSITTSNSSVQVTNPNYTAPESGIIKNRVQIQQDVKKIAAGDEATIAEYTGYMTGDSVHLYTKVGSGTSTNDYAEFRIIQVGGHDGDGTSLTFQATSAIADSQMSSSNTNAGGWEASSLRTSMNSGDIYKKFSSKLTDDIMPVAKTSLSPSGTSWTFAQGVSTTYDKFWLASWGEIYPNATGLNNATHGYFPSQYAYEGSRYAYFVNVGITSNGDSPRNAALSALTAYRDGSNGGEAWMRSAAVEGSTWFAQIASHGSGLDVDTGRPGHTDATSTKKVTPCFSFGDTSTTHTVWFDNNGGTGITEQQVANGAAVGAVTPTKEGYTFVGWYTDRAFTKPYVAETTPVTSDTVLFARWTEAESSVLDSYWLAPSYKYTNGNSLSAVSKVYNADCKQNPQGHVMKTRAQILFDVSRLRAGDNAAYTEYLYYCLSDTAHLYTKTRTQGNDNDFNEFRIVNVGTHGSDGSILTFQQSTAWYTVRSLSQNIVSNYGSADMSTYLNSQEFVNELGGKLYDDILEVNKKYSSIYVDEWLYNGVKLRSLQFGYYNSNYRVWLPSLAEMGGPQAYYADAQYQQVVDHEGSRYLYYAYHGARSVQKNGTIAQLRMSRIGYDFADNETGNCDSDYVIWTRTPTIPDKLFGDPDTNLFDVKNGVFYAYDEDGKINIDDCQDYTFSTARLAYTPCFCF